MQGTNLKRKTKRKSQVGWIMLWACVALFFFLFFFGSGWAAGVVPVRSCWKRPRLQVDLPLAKVEPISNGGSACGKTDLRRGSCSRGEEWNVRGTPL